MKIGCSSKDSLFLLLLLIIIVWYSFCIPNMNVNMGCCWFRKRIPLLEVCIWLHFTDFFRLLWACSLCYMWLPVLFIYSCWFQTYTLTFSPEVQFESSYIWQAYSFSCLMIGFCVGTCNCQGRSFITVCLLTCSREGGKGLNVSRFDVVFLGVRVGTPWPGHSLFVAPSIILHDMTVMMLQGWSSYFLNLLVTSLALPLLICARPSN